MSDLKNTNVLTTDMIVEYATIYPDLSYSELSRKIQNEGGLFQYNSYDSLRRNVRKKLLRLHHHRSIKAVKRVFIDIETSPNIGLFWRAGYKQTITPESILKERAIICICWKWEGHDTVHSLTWDSNQCDKEMLKEFTKVMKDADEIVAHNGDRFDIKWFNTRCLYHNVNIMPKYKTLDTLKKAKAHFLFNSNRLDYIARFLGVGAKMETGGFDLWKNVLLEQCGDSLEKMVEYCKNDVVILEDVYHRMKSYITHNTHHALAKSGKKWECPTCTSINIIHLKPVWTAAGTLQRWMECKDCSTDYKISNKTYKKYLEDKYKKKNEVT